jgi:hypothetical protein
MAAAGLLAIAFARYRNGSDSAGAFWIGFAAGLGICARANCAWLLASVGVALLIMAPRELWRRRKQAPALASGAMPRTTGIVYLACAAYWHVIAIGALRETGGVGLWSERVGHPRAPA